MDNKNVYKVKVSGCITQEKSVDKISNLHLDSFSIFGLKNKLYFIVGS